MQRTFVRWSAIVNADTRSGIAMEHGETDTVTEAVRAMRALPAFRAGSAHIIVLGALKRLRTIEVTP